MQLTDRQTKKLILIFTLTYMVSYITRINYGAVISEMEADTGMTKKMLSLALTGSFFTYAVGQIFSGLAGDRFSPKKLVFLGLSVSVLMNSAVPFCKNEFALLAVWSVNGLAQAFMWPPLVRIMTAVFSPDVYSRASTAVSCGSSIGTIFVYLAAPVLISLSSFRSVFFLSSFMGIVMLVLWQIFAVDVKEIEKSKPQKKKEKTTGLFSPVFICILLSGVCLGIIRDGVTTWMPSLISETFGTNRSAAILSGVILPVFSIFSYNIALKLFCKLKSAPSTSLIAFTATSAAALLLVLFHGRSAVLSIFLMAFITGTMHGATLMMTGMIPALFSRFGNVSTVSGIINSFIYLGSALSTYAVAALTEAKGWKSTLILWLILSVLGAVLTSVAAKAQKRRKVTE